MRTEGKPSSEGKFSRQWVTMSLSPFLRQFVNERLSVAAEEIFTVFEKTLAEYEDEIHRHRKLLGIAWKPEAHAKEFTGKEACNQEEVLTMQLVSNLEKSTSIDQEGYTTTQIKVEQEDLCISKDEDQEAETHTVTHSYSENENCEDQSMCLNPSESKAADDEESVDQASVKIIDVPETQNDDQPLFLNPVHQDHKGEMSGNFQIHVNDEVNPKSSKCETCGKFFKSKFNLMTHIRIHTGEKPYACDFCGHRFTQPSTLKDHVRIHTGERPYSCNICQKTFSKMSILTTHQRTHTGEMPYKCKLCGKCLRTRSGLSIHIRTHTGETPYPCTTCGKRFKDTSILKRHMRTHTGERPYKCDTCGKMFSQMPDLKKHTRIHTGEKPYSCEKCGKDFRSHGNLSAHMRTHREMMTPMEKESL